MSKIYNKIMKILGISNKEYDNENVNFKYLMSKVNITNRSKYTILFNRILHPSGMIKERVCNSFAKLILHNEYQKEVTTLLLQWIAEQKIEMYSIYGLLCFIRANIIDDSFDVSLLDGILPKMVAPSLLAIEIIQEVNPSFNKKLEMLNLYSGDAPDNYRLNPFFQRYVSYFISPKYRYTLTAQQDVPPASLIKQWSYECDELIKKNNFYPRLDPVYYKGNYEFEHYTSFNTILSDIYLSAYLRTIAWGLSHGLSQETVIQMIIPVCPIDFGLWKIKPGPKPVYWPTIETNINEFDASSIWAQIKILWSQVMKDKWILGYINGRLGENGTYYDLKILGFLKNKEKAILNKHEAIFNTLENSYVPNTIWSIKFEGEIKSEEMNQYKLNFEECELLPVSCSIIPKTDSIWQFWREHRLIHFPAPYLYKDKINFQCTENGIDILDKTEIIAKWSDWTDGLSEKRRANLSLRTGNKLMLSKPIIEGYLEQNDLQYCWACNITKYGSQTQRGDYEITNDYMILI